MGKHKSSLLLTILALMWSIASLHASWFSDESADDKDRQIQQLQLQVDDENDANGHLQIVIIILATGVVMSLVVGAAIGSKARKAVEQ